MGHAGFDGFDRELSRWLRGLLWRFCKRLLIVAGLLFLAWLLISIARAQQLCMPPAALAEHLRGQFGEIAAFDFAMPDERPAKFYANAISGTWSITLTRPDGADCVVQSGGGFKPPTRPRAPTL